MIGGLLLGSAVVCCSVAVQLTLFAVEWATAFAVEGTAAFDVGRGHYICCEKDASSAKGVASSAKGVAASAV